MIMDMNDAKRRLGGKVCVVTGAGSGIGRATALRLAAEGAAVCCVDLTAPGEVVAGIEAAGGSALAIAADVTSKATMTEMAARALERFGRIDCAYANAGIPGAGSVVSASEEHWTKVIAVNLTGVYLTMQAVAPAMIGQKSGSIIAQTSVAAFMAFEDAAPYAASGRPWQAQHPGERDRAGHGADRISGHHNRAARRCRRDRECRPRRHNRAHRPGRIAGTGRDA